MKTLKTILIISAVISFSHLGAQVSNYEETIKKYEESINNLQERNQKLDLEISDLESRLDHLKNYDKNYSSHLSDFQKNVGTYLESNNSIFSKLGSKHSFYRCLKKEAESKNSYISLDKCLVGYQSKLTPLEKKEFDVWTNKIGLHPKTVEAKVKSNEQELNSKLSDKTKYARDVEFLKKEVRRNQNILELSKIRKAEENILNKFSNIQRCDSSTPEINLEKEVPFPGANFKGPFVDIPRDNQDGLGTCYANAAKNLIVAGSGGKDVASFLDLAIVYKGEGGLAGIGLDAGHSCDVIEKASEKGFCPQKYAPSEIGEENSYIEGLFGDKKNTVWDQSIINSLVGNFLTDKNALERHAPEIAKNVFDRMKSIVRLIRQNPSVRFPTPIISNRIPSDRKLQDAFQAFKTKDKTVNTTLMHQEYENLYNKFQVQFSKAVLARKTLDEITTMYDSAMEEFFKKYDLRAEALMWKNDFRISVSRQLTDPEARGRLKENLNFMKKILKKEKENDSDFLDYCENFGHSLLNFAGSLKPLIDHLVQVGGRADLLADSSGKLRSAVDIMQLAVAPACINEEARKPLSNQYLCEANREKINQLKAKAIPENEKIKEMRDTVLKSLVQGYAVGNTFERHINTIVGMRFNPQSRECEYLIRESQRGESLWQSEKRIFQKVEALTEVRRK